MCVLCVSVQLFNHCLQPRCRQIRIEDDLPRLAIFEVDVSAETDLDHVTLARDRAGRRARARRRRASRIFWAMRSALSRLQHSRQSRLSMSRVCFATTTAGRSFIVVSSLADNRLRVRGSTLDSNSSKTVKLNHPTGVEYTAWAR